MVRVPFPGFRGALAAVLLAGSSALVACSVAESYRIPAVATDLQQGTPCASKLGSYSLPRAHLRIQVGEVTGKKPGIVRLTSRSDMPVKVVRHPDPALAFCLDHIDSYTADDKIDVVKWPLAAATGESAEELAARKGPFLGALTFNAKDQSVYIINSLVRSLFIFLSGKSDFAPRRSLIDTPTSILADLEFDPFNPNESASVNARLSKLGYCLLLEGYTFDMTRVSVDQYCNNPERYGTAAPALVTKAYMRVAAEPVSPRLPGVHYRPRYPYRLLTLERVDGTGQWNVSRMDTVELENMSPVMTLGVGRAVFAARSTYFLFDEGALLTACISKTSELEGFVKIPLEISRSIVELPAAIFSVRINQFEKAEELAKVQQQLYLAQQAQIAAAVSGNPYEKPKDSNDKYQDNYPKLNIAFDKTFGAAWKTAPAPYPKLFDKDLQKLCSGDGTQ
jgi:hypothetical protein